MKKQTRKKIYRQAMKKFGLEAQLCQLMEECAELIQAANKYRRHADSQAVRSLAEELADVEIMIEQLKFFIDWETLIVRVAIAKEAKLLRLERLVMEDGR